jgi:hypothetical protein
MVGLPHLVSQCAKLHVAGWLWAVFTNVCLLFLWFAQHQSAILRTYPRIYKPLPTPTLHTVNIHLQRLTCNAVLTWTSQVLLLICRYKKWNVILNFAVKYRSTVSNTVERLLSGLMTGCRRPDNKKSRIIEDNLKTTCSCPHTCSFSTLLIRGACEMLRCH